MKARRFKSFLVAVRDIENPPRALLTKAARIAERFGGRLDLLHVIALPYVLPGDTAGSAVARDVEITRQQDKLDRIAERLRKTGVKVTASITWDYPAADAIVRHVFKTKPDVVIAESHHHSKLARWFVAHTDWELVRACPCPLWLVKTPRLADDARVMTAVDPFHTHSKPAALDEEILRVAKIAAGPKGRLGTSHVYPLPITMVAGGMGEPVWVAAPPVEQRRVKQRVTNAVQDIADRFDISKPDRIVQPGDAAVELPALVKRWNANLLVMGAVSRSALKRAFIGHTAERVIDAVHCDVLIIKPRSFKTPVGQTPMAAVLPIPPM
ncbi:MAG TPA: universal stress protein [Steroidobacteraceae bacterium]|nr:universal stress protein [Steroidobacteraceae bacterium]